MTPSDQQPDPCAGNRILVRWLATTAVSAEQWPLLARMLVEAERERALRFHRARDRESYVAAHALLRATLSQLAGGAPQSWQFRPNAWGKPELVRERSLPDFRVNLSHTEGLAAIAVATGVNVGIDVESTRREDLTRELAGSVFAAAECAALDACPPEQLKDALFAFWTLKEAYIKAVGKGLSLDLDGFAFTLDPISVSFAPAIPDDPSEWFFHRSGPTPEHAMAVAARHPRPNTLRVVLQQVSAEDLLKGSRG